MKKSTNASGTDFKASLSQLEKTLNEYFNKKAPALPDGIKEFIVTITPYGALLGIVLAVPALLALLGFSAVFAPMMYASGAWGIRGMVSILVLAITTLFYVLAVQGLFKREKQAWDKLFWISLVHAVGAFLSMNIFGLIIGTAISWYFLFQVRSYYK